MKDKENIEVDKKEFHKQYVEDIKKNQGFVEINILVGKGNNMCIPTFEIHNAGLEEVARMISTLEELTGEICERYPEAKLYADLFIKTESDNFGVL